MLHVLPKLCVGGPARSMQLTVGDAQVAAARKLMSGLKGSGKDSIEQVKKQRAKLEAKKEADAAVVLAQSALETAKLAGDEHALAWAVGDLEQAQALQEEAVRQCEAKKDSVVHSKCMREARQMFDRLCKKGKSSIGVLELTEALPLMGIFGYNEEGACWLIVYSND